MDARDSDQTVSPHVVKVNERYLSSEERRDIILICICRSNLVIVKTFVFVSMQMTRWIFEWRHFDHVFWWDSRPERKFWLSASKACQELEIFPGSEEKSKSQEVQIVFRITLSGIIYMGHKQNTWTKNSSVPQISQLFPRQTRTKIECTADFSIAALHLNENSKVLLVALLFAC
jgi:hypothetical protein